MQETQETWFRSLGQKDPLEYGMVTLSKRYYCLETSQGQRSLGYSPLGLKESDMTERQSMEQVQ